VATGGSLRPPTEDTDAVRVEFTALEPRALLIMIPAVLLLLRGFEGVLLTDFVSIRSDAPLAVPAKGKK